MILKAEGMNFKWMPWSFFVYFQTIRLRGLFLILHTQRNNVYEDTPLSIKEQQVELSTGVNVKLKSLEYYSLGDYASLSVGIVQG